MNKAVKKVLQLLVKRAKAEHLMPHLILLFCKKDVKEFIKASMKSKKKDIQGK